MLAAVYAALVHYIPFAGLITFVLSIGFGVLLGLAIAAALRWAKVRHEGVAFFSSAVAAGSSFYVSWAVWTYLLLAPIRSGSAPHRDRDAAGVLWGVLGEINAVGAWSMSGFTPTGAVLWVLWGAEALLILAPAVLVPFGVLAVPFCERCDVWCEPTEDCRRGSRRLEPAELKSHMDAKDLSALWSGWGRPAAHDDSWIRVDLHDCPSCGNLHTMTLKSITVSVDSDGETQHKEIEVVSHLLLTTDEVHRIRALAPADAA